MSALVPISQPSERATVLGYRNRIVEVGVLDRIRRSWLQEHKWIGVPVEEAPYFCKWSANCLVRACQRFDWQECYAIPTEEKAEECTFKFTVAVEPLLELSDVGVMWVSFVIVPVQLGFAITCDEYFKTCAGPREFVEAAIDDPIDVAREEFDRYFVEEPAWPEAERQTYRDLAQYYRELQ